MLLAPLNTVPVAEVSYMDVGTGKAQKWHTFLKRGDRTLGSLERSDRMLWTLKRGDRTL